MALCIIGFLVILFGLLSSVFFKRCKNEGDGGFADAFLGYICGIITVVVSVTWVAVLVIKLIHSFHLA